VDNSIRSLAYHCGAAETLPLQLPVCSASFVPFHEVANKYARLHFLSLNHRLVEASMSQWDLNRKRRAASPALLLLGSSISILLPTAIFLKVLSNSYRNLIICHLVHCFNTNDASTKMEGIMIMLWRVDQVSSAQRA
jgi:hypothetical protein